jgi:hypothetical protein
MSGNVTFYALIFFVCTASAHAQIFDKNRGKNVQKLIAKTAHVYTYGNTPFTDRLKSSMKDYWKISAFEFHDVSGGLPSLEDESAVFMPGVVSLTVRDNETAMNSPFFVYGEAGTSGLVSGEAIIAAFPINGFHYEFDVLNEKNMYSRSMLRLPYMVYNLNDMLTYIKTNGSDNGYFKGIEKKTGSIAAKTMIIPADLTAECDVNPNTTALMKNRMEAGRKPMKAIMAAVLSEGDISFAGKYKIMKTEDIVKLEQSADADKYTLFLPAINNSKYLMVFDLKTKELLYYDKVLMGMKIKEKDFDKLNKAAGL